MRSVFPEVLRGARILLVEDDSMVLRAESRVLRDTGAAVSGVGNAQEALDALSAATYDILVIDLGLPDRDGEDLIREIRTRYPRVGIVIFTARCEPVGAGLGCPQVQKTAESEELIQTLVRSFRLPDI